MAELYKYFAICNMYLTVPFLATHFILLSVYWHRDKMRVVSQLHKRPLTADIMRSINYDTYNLLLLPKISESKITCPLDRKQFLFRRHFF